MNQSKYWRFDINQSNDQSGQSTGSSGRSGQDSGNAFLVIESNDQQTAVRQAQEILGSQQTSNLGTPTQVDESTARQFTSERSPQTA